MNVHAVGDNISALLESRNLSAAWLTEQLNVNTDTVERWLSGKRQPPVYAVYRISKLFEVSMESLVNGISDNQDAEHEPESWDEFLKRIRAEKQKEIERNELREKDRK